MEIINLINNSKAVKDFQVLDYKIFKTGFFIKINVILIDNSRLIIREFFSEYERSYSYHWQDKNKNLIIRWDNAPYHKEINTHPFHKHINNNVLPSNEIIIQDVFQFIEKELLIK